MGRVRLPLVDSIEGALDAIAGIRSFGIAGTNVLSEVFGGRSSATLSGVAPFFWVFLLILLVRIAASTEKGRRTYQVPEGGFHAG